MLTEPPLTPPPPSETVRPADPAPPAGDRRRRWVPAAAGVLAVLAVVFAGLWLSARSDLTSARGRIATFESADSARQAAADARPDLAAAVSSYNLDRYQESGASAAAASLHFGSDASGWESELEACLDHIGFNGSAVVARMGKTRALDGTQSADGRHVHATWTYHPDHGLNVVLEATG
ncbi:MAG: hypothetical protein QOI42_1857 [Frankiaceae bacterium]|nr:hypothetical protein [Frankiaceae bacterium]